MVEGQVGVLSIWGWGPAAHHTLEVASMGRAGPDRGPTTFLPCRQVV